MHRKANSKDHTIMQTQALPPPRNYYVIKGDVLCINNSNVKVEMSRNVPVCVSNKMTSGKDSRFRATHAKFLKR